MVIQDNAPSLLAREENLEALPNNTYKHLSCQLEVSVHIVFYIYKNLSKKFSLMTSVTAAAVKNTNCMVSLFRENSSEKLLSDFVLRGTGLAQWV